MSRVARLAATAVLAAVLYAGWAGLRLGPVQWGGATAVIGGTWLWDLRWALLPGYVVAVLWAVERIAARLPTRE